MPAKNNQENTERLQKKFVKDIKIFLNKQRKKATLWLWTLQKSHRNEKPKLVEHRKKCHRIRKSVFF